MRYSRITYLVLVIALGIACVAAYVTLPASKPADNSAEVLHVALLPDENTDALLERYKPLAAYLAKVTGREIKLLIPADYQASVDIFRAREADIALYGGLTFLKANRLYGAKPLVSRDVDMRFTSRFIVSGNSPIKALRDLHGHDLAFGSELSTSGHLMPRYFMESQLETTAEAFFSKILFSGAHDKTAYMVRDQHVDVGVANTEILQSMLRDGRLQQNDIRVLWETPPYPDYTWATPAYLDENTRTLLRDAFLSIDANNTEHQEILTNLGSQGFVPAGLRDFAQLQQIASTLGMLEK